MLLCPWRALSLCGGGSWRPDQEGEGKRREEASEETSHRLCSPEFGRPTTLGRLHLVLLVLGRLAVSVSQAELQSIVREDGLV